MEGFQQLLAVFVVLGILCGGLWLLKRKGWAQTALRRSCGQRILRRVSPTTRSGNSKTIDIASSTLTQRS